MFTRKKQTEDFGPPQKLPALAKKIAEAPNEIASMKPGNEGWTLPWALSMNADGEMFIDGKYPVDPNRGGTCQLLIGRRPDGTFFIDCAHLEFKDVEGIMRSQSNDRLVPIHEARNWGHLLLNG